MAVKKAAEKLRSARNGIEVSIRAKEKIMRNTQTKARRPSKALAKRPEALAVYQQQSLTDFEVFYTDFTEICNQQGRTRAYWMPIIDHSSKVIVGHALGENANTELAMEAWRKAKFMLRRLCLKTEGIIIHHDQDGVYIGHRCLRQVAVKDKVRVSYSDDGVKGNVYLESFIGRFKSENRLLFWEQEDFVVLKEVVRERVRYYNRV